MTRLRITSEILNILLHKINDGPELSMPESLCLWVQHVLWSCLKLTRLENHALLTYTLNKLAASYIIQRCFYFSTFTEIATSYPQEYIIMLNNMTDIYLEELIEFVSILYVKDLFIYLLYKTQNSLQFLLQLGVIKATNNC